MTTNHPYQNLLINVKANQDGEFNHLQQMLEIIGSNISGRIDTLDAKEADTDEEHFDFGFDNVLDTLRGEGLSEEWVSELYGAELANMLST